MAGGAITDGATITVGGAAIIMAGVIIIAGEKTAGRRVQSPLLSRSKAISLSNKAGISLSGTIFGPSEKASSGRS
jgi:hypothetical protein